MAAVICGFVSRLRNTLADTHEVSDDAQVIGAADPLLKQVMRRVFDHLLIRSVVCLSVRFVVGGRVIFDATDSRSALDSVDKVWLTVHSVLLRIR